MNPAEPTEPVEQVEPVETLPEAAVEPIEAAPVEEEVQQPAADAAPVDFASLVKTMEDGGVFKDLDDTDEGRAALREMVTKIRPQDMAKLSPEARAVVRWAKSELEAARTALNAPIETERAKLAEERKAFAAEQARAKREQAAFYALSRSKGAEALQQKVESAKTADLTTPEGIKAYLDAKAAESALATLQPFRESAAEADRQLTVASMEEKFPDFAKAEVRADVEAYLTDLDSKGIKIEGRLEEAIEVVLGRRARAASEARQAQETVQRVAATRHVSRATTGAAARPEPGKIPAMVGGERTAHNPSAVYEHLQGKPADAKALINNYFTPR